MAENDTTPTPMTDADINAAPAGTAFEPAAPLKDAGVEFRAEGGTPSGDENGGGTGGQSGGGQQGGADIASDPKQAVREGVSNFSQQFTDKTRSLVDEGRSRATGALDQLVQMLNDAAGQVDEKLGGQYGNYARNAATSVQGFAETVRNKDTDALMDDARGFVRQSPAVVIGVAAALGFAVARLVQSGLDDQQSA